MILPDRINGKWVATLEDKALMSAERSLHKTFTALEREEKKAKGAKYQVLQGSDALLSAWQRWSLLNAAVRSRGLTPAYRP
jgi:hypothetical protein